MTGLGRCSSWGSSHRPARKSQLGLILVQYSHHSAIYTHSLSLPREFLSIRVHVFCHQSSFGVQSSLIFRGSRFRVLLRFRYTRSAPVLGLPSQFNAPLLPLPLPAGGEDHSLLYKSEAGESLMTAIRWGRLGQADHCGLALGCSTPVDVSVIVESGSNAV